MSIKSDNWIRNMAVNHGMIAPFIENSVRKSDHSVISYGLSSYGYDVRIARQFKIFTNVRNAIVDPKKFDETAFVHHEGDVCIIPPNSFVLGYSVERFKIPRNIMTIVLGKSSYARCGLIVNVTPLEPQWAGHITLEISNTTPLPAKVYANEGVAQVLFFEGDEPCKVSYSDHNGKYQNQPAEVVLPKL